MVKFNKIHINKFSEIFFKFIFISFLFLCASAFYYFNNVDETLKIFKISQYTNHSFSDLGRYSFAYNNLNDYSLIISRGFDEKIIYFLFTAFLSFLGVPFEFFLVLVIFSYYLIFIKIFYFLTSCKDLIIYFPLLLFLSYWMQPLVTVALPQGVSFIFLIYFLFRKENPSTLYKFLIIIFASLIHFSAIFLIPIIFLDKIFITKLILFEILFLITALLYVANYTFIFSNFIIYFANIISLDIGALGNQNNTYIVGFSLLKFLAIIIPIILFKFLNFEKLHSSYLAKRIYLYYLFIGISGMVLSNLPYHDRIFLYAWGVSPIFLTLFLYVYLIRITK